MLTNTNANVYADLLAALQRRVQRHHKWREPRVRHARLHGDKGMGPRHRCRHTQPHEATYPGAGAAVIFSNFSLRASWTIFIVVVIITESMYFSFMVRPSTTEISSSLHVLPSLCDRGPLLRKMLSYGTILEYPYIYLCALYDSRHQHLDIIW